jgi:lipopolysaccharide transport system ATP-binding protein
MSTVISVENLGKKYLLSHQTQRQPYVALRDVIAEKTHAIGQHLLHPFRSSTLAHRSSAEEFWALKDVSFEISQGDRVGIIGRNGAGKSTLLKILSRITEPSTGRVRIKGRVASLLEVGTGFHPELTGRENIYLNGAILGMTRADIKKKFDEIVTFAEIEKFLDTPVKRYSSGMYVRLAFAVAAHLEPEILLIDEVLAVGDAQFQKKCLGKMEEVSSTEGRTVLFVSHNMAAVTQLCKLSLWIDRGQIAMCGASCDVINTYLTKGTPSNGECTWDHSHAPGNEKIRLKAVRLRDDGGAVSAMFGRDKPIAVELEYQILQPQNGIRTGFWLYSSDGTLVFVAGDNEDKEWSERKRLCGTYCSTCIIPGGLLNSGIYSITAAADIQGYEMLFIEPNVISFSVEQTDTTVLDGFGRSPGIICPSMRWRITQIGQAG